MNKKNIKNKAVKKESLDGVDDIDSFRELVKEHGTDKTFEIFEEELSRKEEEKPPES